MYEIDVIVPGYTHDSKVSAETLKKALGEQGDVEVVVVDVFEKERKNWLFQKTLLTTSNHVSAVETMEAQVKYLTGMKVRFHDVRIRKLYTHSYGATAILAPSLDAEEYIIIAPPLESVQWKSIEKLFWFLPGFKELRNGYLQQQLLQKLSEMKANGKYVIIAVSRFNDIFGDERVTYSEETMEKMFKLANVMVMNDVKHSQFMKDPSIVQRIVEST